MLRIIKSHNHIRFLIQDEILLESYKTTRSIKVIKVVKVPNMPDNENCDDA